MSPPYKVYLAGPISGCNDDQRRHWRAEVHEKARHFDIIDPTANLDLEASVYEVIERDLKYIEEADGLLVCMWKESIGTAVGMVHARAKGKVVVVVDPNRLNNRMLEFYADAVVRTVGDAVKVLERLLRAERAVIVLKKDGSERPFDRGVLVESLREVCRRAGRHDIIVPQLVLVRALAELDGRIGRAGQHRVTTTDIERSVAGALAALEASEEHREAVGGVAEAWKARVGGKGAAEPSSRAGGDAGGPVLAVCGGPISPVRHARFGVDLRMSSWRIGAATSSWRSWNFATMGRAARTTCAPRSSVSWKRSAASGRHPSARRTSSLSTWPTASSRSRSTWPLASGTSWSRASSSAWVRDVARATCSRGGSTASSAKPARTRGDVGSIERRTRRSCCGTSTTRPPAGPGWRSFSRYSRVSAVTRYRPCSAS